MLDLVDITNFTKARIKKNLILKTVFYTLKTLGFSKRDIQTKEISIVFCGDTRMRGLNKEYRKKNKTTDVLSFSFNDSELSFNKDALGEIFISVPQAKRQAKQKGVSLDKELALLTAHGVIHLCGIDHTKNKDEEILTEKIQNKVLDLVFHKN